MDSELLPARILDLKYLCEKTSTPKFLGFLTPSEAAVVVKQFKDGESYRLYGGYEEAERTVLCVLPDWCEDPVYPITSFTFTYRKCDKLTHRDFLGALMALGIARETVGDILVEDGRAVVFILKDVSNFVSSQISKIGRVGVAVTEGFCGSLPTLGKKESFTTTVASTRLDCIVAALCGFSRKDAAEKIADGLVFVNSVCCAKVTHNVIAGSIVTVRQKGKFEITGCEEHSKKGRIILKYNMYK